MEALWDAGPSTIRKLRETFPVAQRPAYTTIQTIVYRLEGKAALRRTGEKMGNADVFEAVISRQAAYQELIEEFMSVFGRSVPVVLSLLVDVGNSLVKESGGRAAKSRKSPRRD